jgi:hypothetical protein
VVIAANSFSYHDPEIGDALMKRSVLSGLTLGTFVLGLSLVGCGSSGIDEGVPTDTSNVKPLPKDMTNMGGRMAKDMTKAQAKAKAAAQANPPTTEEPK